MKQDKFEELLIKLWDRFDEFMVDNWYEIMVNNDNQMGQGTIAFKKDKFVPIIKLSIHNQEKWVTNGSSIVITVTDRLGNNIITGNTVEINKVECGLDSKIEDVEDRFNAMMLDTFENYSGYTKENKLNYDGEIIRNKY